MPADFDDFLGELRTQLVRSARAAAREGARPATAQRPWQVRPRIALAFAVGLLVPVAVAVAVVLYSTSATPGLAPSGQTNGLLPGAGHSPAFVQPLGANGTTSPAPTPESPVELSYSLWAVASRASNDAWAVGSRTRSDGGGAMRAGSFVLHWNGATWSETAAPDIGPLSTIATAPNGEAWALGSDAATFLHWNGARWAAVASGAPAGAALKSVAVVTSDDVWAVGSRPGAPLIMHWNGISWQLVEAPVSSPAGGSLSVVSAASPTSVWAVGSDPSGSRALVLHWNGRAWSPVVIGDPAASGSFAAQTAAAPSSTDVWVAGERIAHWDGTQWSDVATPIERFTGPMSVVSSSDIWLRGDDRRSVVHWDGAAWRSIAAGEMGLSADAALSVQAVAAAPGTGVWAVGSIENDDGLSERPLILHFNGSAWRLVVDAAQVYGEE
jgi:hypothetical protein